MSVNKEQAAARGGIGVHHVECSRHEKLIRLLLALSLAFLLLPLAALQPLSALADEADLGTEAEATEEAGASEDGDAFASQWSADGEAPSEGGAEDAVLSEEDADDAEAGIALHDEVGMETIVQGSLEFWRWVGWDDEASQVVEDTSFGYGLNKVAIDLSRFGGTSRAVFHFNPEPLAGQDQVMEDWYAIPDEQKYGPENVRVFMDDPEVLRLVDLQTEDGPCLEFFSEKPGQTNVVVDYSYVNPESGVTYEGHVQFTAHVVDAPNEAVAVDAPSEEVTVWAYGSFTDPADTSWYQAYYYEYDAQAPYAYQPQEYLVGCDTRVGDAPATFSFDELFDITIADEGVISAVHNNYRSYVSGEGFCYGPDRRTYSLDLVPVAAGSTDITISLKQAPEQSVTFRVNVVTDHPEAVVADHEMQVNAARRIYVESGRGSSDASAIYLPMAAQYLYYATSQARPFIKEIQSSDPDVVTIKSISSPSYSFLFAPFEIVPLSVGTADITLTDCYGKTYGCTITVKPDPNDNADPSVSIDSVTLKHDGASASKSMVTLSTRDAAGVPLSAEVLPADVDVTIRWTSSNEGIATVDEHGVVRPVRASFDERSGKMSDCRITVTANGEVSDYCDITVEAAEDLCTAAADSPLGAASIKLPNALPTDLLAELDAVSLSIQHASSAVIDEAAESLQSAGAKLQGVYDIHFVNKADGAEHPWSEPDYPLVVQIPMDEEMRELYRHGTLAFYHIDPSTGARTKMRTWVSSDLSAICFETTHFSPFALVAEPSSSGSDGFGGAVGNGQGSTDAEEGLPRQDGMVIIEDEPQVQQASVGGVPNAALAQTGDVASKLLAVALLCVAGALAVAAVANRKRLGLAFAKKR